MPNEIMIFSIRQCGPAPWLGYLFLVITMILLGFAIGALIMRDIIAVPLFCLVALLTVLTIFGFVGERYTEAMAYIPETVSFSEVTEKYEILRRKGDLWVLKVKENTDVHNDVETD